MTKQSNSLVRWQWPVAMALALLGSTGLAATTTRQCTDPCIQAARGEARDCTSSASGAFVEALNGCLQHDRMCLDACRADAQDCRAATSLPGDLAKCELMRLTDEADCRSQFPLGSRRLAACLDRAAAAHSSCRREARRDARRAVAACAATFTACAESCLPGEPPGGADSCKSEVKSAFKSDLRTCHLTFQVTLSTCIGKDASCVPTCSVGRAICTASTRATLDATITACNATRDVAVSDCVAQNPSGSDALQACIDAAQATVFTCRDAAVAAAAPGFEACVQPFLKCLRACPAA